MIVSWFVIGSLLAVWMGPLRAGAQGDGKHPAHLSWNDAPVLPYHRSQADWLLDVGRKTFPEVYGPFPTHEYQVGEEEQFIPLGTYDNQPETFVLRYRSDHAYYWFNQGEIIDPDQLKAAALFFEDHIWPLNTSIYGSLVTNGIDGDIRLHVVSQSSMNAGVMGAFNPDDQCPQFICPDSNQREIVYINLGLAPLDSPEWLATLAHEHQHLIQYSVDGNEMRWLDEGLSQLAEHLNGFDPQSIGGSNLTDFLAAPDLLLNGWAEDVYDLGRYYGAGYLFTVYLYERFGLDFIRALVRSSYDGLASVEHALEETGAGITLDAVFADWILANYLDDPYVGAGHYYYQTIDLPRHIRPETIDTGTPYHDTVNQYGADYLRVRGSGVYELSFDGSERSDILNTVPQSGDWMWWSNKNINSASRLTGAFDLSGLDRATLEFSAWWDVESDYDWFQVLVSADGGHDWQIVSGSRAITGGEKAPGAYYSGRSGTWVKEHIDLRDYAGKPVLVRFEYLTDGSQTNSGVALDDVGIVELGYNDNVEAGQSVWNPDGFLRIPSEVDQNWTVWVVYEQRGQHATVERMSLDDLHTGRLTVTIPDGGTATIIVGAAAPFSEAPATYKLVLLPQN